MEELDELQEEESEADNSKTDNRKEFKQIVIDTCTGIIERYKAMMVEKNDDPFFIANLDNEKKTVEECINYIMNNLVAQRIYGGEDSIMWPYIHDYYVDEGKVKYGDNWSNQIGNGSNRSQKAEPKLTEEQKKKLMEKAEQEFIQEQKRKLEEKEKERIKKEKEKEQKRKEQEALKKAKDFEEAKANGGGAQTSLFDFL